MASPRRKIADLTADLRTAASSPVTDHPADGFLGARVGGFFQIDLEQITPDPDQPRKHFDAGALEELATSIRQDGVLAPISVIQNPTGVGFRIIFGERRYRAARMAGLKKIPAIVSDGKNLRVLQIVENSQRQDLHPMELANSLFALKQETGWSDARLADAIGKGRSTVTELLALTELPDDIKEQMSAADNPPKTLILEAFRKGGAEKVRAILSGDQPVTRSQIRKKKEGRPKNYKYVFNDPSGARVTVDFQKSKVESGEVEGALKAALESFL
jgi:ParB/RepB/Spo0J family partition protein